MKLSINGDVVTFSVARKFSSLSGRESINGFSKSSRGRLVRYLRSSVAVYDGFVTLTLPDVGGIDFLHRSAFRAFIERCRRSGFLDHEGASICWFREFTERGRPHYHFFTNFWIGKDWLSKSWAECVKRQALQAGLEFSDEQFNAMVTAGTRVERLKFQAGTARRSIAHYASKYAAKSNQKEVPTLFQSSEASGQIGRFWGIVGSRDTVSAAMGTEAETDGQVADFIRKTRKSMKKLVNDNKATQLHMYGNDIYIIRDFAIAENLYKRMREHNECRSNVITSQFARNREDLLRRTRQELHVKLYATEGAKRDYAPSWINA